MIGSMQCKPVHRGLGVGVGGLSTGAYPKIGLEFKIWNVGTDLKSKTDKNSILLVDILMAENEQFEI